MGNLTLGIAFFGLFLISHVGWFRVRLPRRQLRVLLMLSAFWLAVYVAALIVFPNVYRLGVDRLAGLFGVRLTLTSIVIYVLACVAYMIVHSGTEVESPSLRIVMLVHGHPTGRMTGAELREVFTNERVILARVDDLVTSGLAAFDGKHYRLLPRGEVLARIFGAYRRLLGRGLGG